MNVNGVEYAVLSATHASMWLGWKARDARQRLQQRDQGRTSLHEQWLTVRGRVMCARGEWTFVDSCLMESEAAALAQWLGTRPWPNESTLKFLEPCLEFIAGGTRANRMVLRVRFRAEAAPPWIQGPDAQWREGWTIELNVTENDLASFAATVRRLIGIPGS